MSFEGKWEKRWHPLREEWVVYAAHRNTRPWTTDTIKKEQNESLEYDPQCYLCPGNKRIHGDTNPAYKDIFIFDNDHPVVGLDAPEVPAGKLSWANGISSTEKAFGLARVVCYDPRHNVSLSEVPVETVVKVLTAWKEEMITFKAMAGIRNVLIFENKGKEVGVSNPHPHCQIYAVDFVFKIVQQHLDAAEKYKRNTGLNIFDEIIKQELMDGARIIAENEHAVAFIPYFARYAYEVMLFPKRRHADLTTLEKHEISGLAEVFQTLIRKFDGLYGFSFPYVMSIIQAPFDGKQYPEHHLYFWFQPPLRQPGLLKYPAGPEIGIGNFMADTIPEEKAEELRKVSI